jgi:hypothetical protein
LIGEGHKMLRKGSGIYMQFDRELRYLWRA